MSALDEGRRSRGVGGAGARPNDVHVDAQEPQREETGHSSRIDLVTAIARPDGRHEQEKPFTTPEEADDYLAGNKFDNLRLETAAAQLCARVLANGKSKGRFSMSMSSLRKASGLSRAELQSVFAFALRNKWLRLRTQGVELTAAGIFVAKDVLHLPR